MTAEEIRAHMNEMADRSAVVVLSDLLDNHAISCVDGRKGDRVVGAPGGNMGLLILMLAAYERFTGGSLAEDALAQVFEQYLGRFGRFYMHTDELAVEQLWQSMKADESLRPYVKDRAVAAEHWMRRPPAEAQIRLLRLLIQPECMGCGHLRLILEHPDEYGVRIELVQSILTLFFRRLWQGDDRLILDVLEGAHEELAVVCVRVEYPEGNGQGTVLAYPSYADSDIFVYHPDAVSYLYAENAQFLWEIGSIEEDEVDAVSKLQDELGREHLAVTLRYLARELPVYDATFEVTHSRVRCTDAKPAG